MNRRVAWLVPMGIIALVMGCNRGLPAEPTTRQQEELSKNSALTFVALRVPNMT